MRCTLDPHRHNPSSLFGPVPAIIINNFLLKKTDKLETTTPPGPNLCDFEAPLIPCSYWGSYGPVPGQM